MSQSIEQYREKTKRAFDNVCQVYVDLKVSLAGKVQNATDVLQQGGNLCLAGAAGSGKTTVLRRLAALLADKDNKDCHPPILVPMRNAPANLSSVSARTLLSECSSPEPPNELLDRLDCGDSAFILLDGLDEMQPSNHSQFKEVLTRWKAEYSQAVWLLSTRPHFVALIPQTYEIAELLPLDDSQVQEYLAKRQQSIELRSTITKITEWSSLRTLALNPLLLDMMSRLSEEVGTLPSSRAELYSSCVDLLLRRWDKTRGIPVSEERFSPEHVRSFLSEIALDMVVSNRNSVAEADVLKAVSSKLKAEDAPFAQDRSLLSSAFLFRTKPMRFEFVHKSFQEYFAALAITSRSPSEVADILASTDSETLLEFIANLSDGLENVIRKLVGRGQFNVAFRLLYMLPPEQRLVRLHFLKDVAQRLGMADVVVHSSEDGIARTTELSQLWAKCQRAANPQMKGRYLEDFVEALFAYVFHIVSKDRLTDFGEIDLICEQRELNAFWGRWQSDFFVECKNHKDKSPVSDINEFIGKASACGASLAFFVSMTGFTRYAINSLRGSWGKPGVPDVVWVSGKDIEGWLEYAEAIESFLKRMCRRANWGR